jgi:hypothetical protein
MARKGFRVVEVAWMEQSWRGMKRIRGADRGGMEQQRWPAGAEMEMVACLSRDGEDGEEGAEMVVL